MELEESSDQIGIYEAEDDINDSIIEAELEDLVEEDNDPSYVPPVKKRKSERLEGKSGPDYHPFRKNRDSNRIKDEVDKRMFYDAIKKCGSKDWRQVAACVPGKSEDTVKRWIQKEKRNQLYSVERRVLRVNEIGGLEEVVAAFTNGKLDRKKSNQTEEPNLNDPEQIKNLKIEEALVKNESLAPIDKWIDIIQAKETRMKERQQQSQASDSDTPKDANCDRVISMGLNWLAEFEPHPDPEECGGIDYAALYRYFAHLSEGEVPPDLDPVSAARVTKLMADMSYMLDRTLQERETEYLENYRGAHTRYRTSDSFDSKSSDVQKMGELSSIPGMNPLGLHLELFANRKIDTEKLVVVTKQKKEKLAAKAVSDEPSEIE